MNLPQINNFDIIDLDEKFNSMKLKWTNVKNFQS